MSASVCASIPAICPPIPWHERLAVTLSEASAILSLSKRTITRLLADGKLKACRDGGHVRVDVRSLISYHESTAKPRTRRVLRRRPRNERGQFVQLDTRMAP